MLLSDVHVEMQVRRFENGVLEIFGFANIKQKIKDVPIPRRGNSAIAKTK